MRARRVVSRKLCRSASRLSALQLLGNRSLGPGDLAPPAYGRSDTLASRLRIGLSDLQIVLLAAFCASSRPALHRTLHPMILSATVVNNVSSASAWWALVLAGLVGGLAGALGGWLTAKVTSGSAERVATAGREHELELTRSGYEHERLLESDRLIQRRFEDTYVDLVDYLNRHEVLCRMRFDILNNRPLPVGLQIPDVPPDDDMYRIRARVDAYGSLDVRTAMAKWVDALQRFNDSAENLRRQIANDPTVEPGDWGVVTAAVRLVLTDATEKVKEAARADLHGSRQRQLVSQDGDE